MASPQKTYELKVQFQKSKTPKDAVISWLQDQGEDTFVEGVLDDLDIAFDYLGDTTSIEEYESLGGDRSPLSLFKYSQPRLVTLQKAMKRAFGEDLDVTVTAQDTQVWQDGWKESFRPVYADVFCVYPPWERPEGIEKYIGVEIDPGMAFGTGQHETTQLCLSALYHVSQGDLAGKSLLDVGTGSGVLAISAKKLGYGFAVGCDIEEDAVTASAENSDRNGVEVALFQGSLPLEGVSEKRYDLVVANILGFVLRKLFFELSQSVAPKGRLILSGLLEEEREEFEALGKERGLVVVGASSLSGWLQLTFAFKGEAS